MPNTPYQRDRELTELEVQIRVAIRDAVNQQSRKHAQAALHGTWHRLGGTCGPDLLHCYDIPGLPPDNLRLESLFGQLRCHLIQSGHTVLIQRGL